MILNRYHWPNVYQKVKDYVKNCEVCTVAKLDFPTPKARMSQLLFKKPNGLLCIDFLTLDKATSGIKNVLILTDVSCRFSRAIATKDQMAQTVAIILWSAWKDA